MSLLVPILYLRNYIVMKICTDQNFLRENIDYYCVKEIITQYQNMLFMGPAIEIAGHVYCAIVRSLCIVCRPCGSCGVRDKRLVVL
jgi:hypothetical protein